MVFSAKDMPVSVKNCKCSFLAWASSSSFLCWPWSSPPRTCQFLSRTASALSWLGLQARLFFVGHGLLRQGHASFCQELQVLFLGLGFKLVFSLLAMVFSAKDMPVSVKNCKCSFLA